MRLKVLAVLVLMLMTFSAMAVPLAAGQQTSSLVVAVTGAPDPIVFNPIRETNTYYASEIWLGMVGWDSKGAYTPLLAKSWVISQDGLTMTFYLRDGLKWSDGQPLTSADVAWSFKAFAEQSNPWYYLFYPIESPATNTTTHWTITPGAIETPNSTTITFHLSSPSAPFFIYVGGNWILPEHTYKSFDFNSGNPAIPGIVGSGSFIPTSFAAGDQLVMGANQYYLDGTPKLSQVIFKYYSTSASAEIAFQTGQAQYLQSVPSTDISKLSSLPGVTIAREEPQVERYLMFNMYPTLADGTPNPVNNTLVRRAIAYSLDLNNILNSTYGTGNYLLANQIQVPNMFYGSASVTNTTIPSPEYPQNVTMANKLLDQAGYPAGSGGSRFTISLIAQNTGSATQTKLLQLIQSRLAAVGITLQVILYDAATYYQKSHGDPNPKTWNIAVGSLSSSPDADVACFYVVSGLAGNAGAGGWNGGGYNDTNVNKLTLLEENTTNVQQRVAIIQKISGIVHEQLPVLMLSYDIEVIAYNSAYKGFTFGLGQPETDYWGALKPQSLAQVYYAGTTTSTTTTTSQSSGTGTTVTVTSTATSTATTGTDNTLMYVAIIAVAVVLVAALAVFALRRRGRPAQ